MPRGLFLAIPKALCNEIHIFCIGKTLVLLILFLGAFTAAAGGRRGSRIADIVFFGGRLLSE